MHFVGTGISGRELGALEGPSIMPGGARDAYEEPGPILESIAAQVDGEPCCAWLGPDGAGHFVKMVHNGIEYADMQFISEAFDLLSAAGLSARECAAVFREWNDGDLGSFLVEITAQVLDHDDAATGRPLVERIRDEAEQKGTGRWTVQVGLELGSPCRRSPRRSSYVLRRATRASATRRLARWVVRASTSMAACASWRTSGLRCGARALSAIPKACNRFEPPASSTTGVLTSRRWLGSGEAAASSVPACSHRSPTSMPRATPPPCSWPRASRPGWASGRMAGFGRSRQP